MRSGLRDALIVAVIFLVGLPLLVLLVWHLLAAEMNPSQYGRLAAAGLLVIGLGIAAWGGLFHKERMVLAGGLLVLLGLALVMLAGLLASSGPLPEVTHGLRSGESGGLAGIPLGNVLVGGLLVANALMLHRRFAWHRILTANLVLVAVFVALALILLR
jgi:hypothetical protein